jgi:ubiquinone/menaquinone biosynthesis C-methylase UbiE
MTSSNQEAHYGDVAQHYNQAWFYEDGTDYQRWLVQSLMERLQTTPSGRVVDLGGGTGNFSAALHKECKLEQRILCVDPSGPLLAQCQKHVASVEPLLADGLGFVAKQDQEQAYDRMLLKEVIHHFPPADLGILFAGAFRQIRPGGRVTIMTRPHDSSHYPFFPAAHQTWASVQLHENVYAQAMEKAGFAVTLDHADYPVEMPLSRWLDMVNGRFWSTLHGFSEGEMKEGLEQIRAMVLEEGKEKGVWVKKEEGEGKEGEEEEGDDDPTITFPDRIVFITGVKI